MQAIARQTAAHDPREFAERFGRRIQSLASSQDLLVKSGWNEIPLDELVRLQLAPVMDHPEERVAIRGPDLRITAAAAQAIGMALHELATNAAKYGCLSVAEGRIAVEWRIAAGEPPGNGCFVMRWAETGGPTIAAPERRGFGSTVIDSMVRMSLDGDVTLDYAPSGLAWEVRCPLHKLTGTSDHNAPGVSAIEAGPSSRPTIGRVLIVEDEALVALEIQSALTQADFEVVGPASSVAQALDLFRRFGCDVAVLDINLGIGSAEPIATALARAGKPFLTISGYAPRQRPAAFLDAPHLGKPFQPDALIAEVARCLKRAAA